MTPTPKRPNHPRPDDAALLRYVSRESPLAESRAISEWLEADPDLAASVAELRAAWSSRQQAPDAWFDASAVWERLAAETQPTKPPRRHSSPNVIPLAVRQRSRVAPLAIAASLVIAAAVGGMFWRRSAARPPVEPTVTYRE